jgi:hypothetical protein
MATVKFKKRLVPDDLIFTNDEQQTAIDIAVERFCRAWDALEDAVAENEWYVKVSTARANLNVSDAALARAWEAAKAEGGEKQRLCLLWEEAAAAGQEVLTCEQRAAYWTAQLRKHRSSIAAGAIPPFGVRRVLSDKQKETDDATPEEEV